MRNDLKLPLGLMTGWAAAAAMIAVHPDRYSKLDVPLTDLGPVRGPRRRAKRNPNAAKQAAAKRARKITKKA